MAGAQGIRARPPEEPGKVSWNRQCWSYILQPKKKLQQVSLRHLTLILLPFLPVMANL